MTWYTYTATVEPPAQKPAGPAPATPSRVILGTEGDEPSAARKAEIDRAVEAVVARRQPAAYSFECRLPCYPIDVLVSIGQTTAEITQQMQTIFGCTTCVDGWSWEPEGKTAGHTAIFPCNKVALWLPTGDITPDTLATITHESYHAVYASLARIGLRMDDHCEDAVAYAVGNLVRLITTRLMAPSAKE